MMVKGIGGDRVKMTFSLWKDDVELLHDVFFKTGADTLSEVVRNCIRSYAAALDDENKHLRRPKMGGRGGKAV